MHARLARRECVTDIEEYDDDANPGYPIRLMAEIGLQLVNDGSLVPADQR